MTDPIRLDDAARRQLDAICDQFESEWRGGGNPRIEEHLDKVAPGLRDPLLRELLLVEWELMEAAGNVPDLGAFTARFQDHSDLIRSLFRQRTDKTVIEPSAANATSGAPKQIAHYTVIRPLGAGGMGEVLLATDNRLGRKVAVKLLPLEWARDSQRRQRFFNEARAASALNHPNVCILHEVGETADGQPYLTMEYLEGATLDRRIQARKFGIDDIIEVAIQIADALEAAHTRGVVHRDLKPGNISLSDRGVVKVLDFGLAKILSEAPPAASDATTAHATHAGQILGTPNYMSPEQAGGREVDPRSDLFSLGIVVYELLTGRLPFSGANLGETMHRIMHAQPEAIARFNYDVPPELERIVRKLLEKDPSRRFQTAADLLVDLRNLRRDLAADATPAGRINPAVPGPELTQPVPQPLNGGKTVDAEVVADGEVLLNFAPVDDQPMFEGRQGWVSQLYRHLTVRMEQLTGERVKIARHPGFTGQHETDLELQRSLPNVKAMVSVISPPFIKRDGCLKEVQQFCQSAEQSGGLWVENKPRLFKVMKRPVGAEIPGDLGTLFSQLFGFEFYEQDPVSGRIREFDEAFGETLKQRFHERLYDLAYEVCQVLRILKQLRSESAGPATPAGRRQVIYLAMATSDLQPEWDRIRRELIERGHVVLPETPLPLSAKELERVVRGHLEKCSAAIHLLGSNYGVSPEDSAESLPCLQVKLSAGHARSGNLKRYLWMPGNRSVEDPRQQDFLRRVQEDPALHDSAEIIEGDLSLLKREVLRWLEPPKPGPVIAQPSGSGRGDGPPKVYLICEPRDEEAIEPLEDYLYAQGLEVCLPAFDGSDADADSLHRENLLTCDGAIVFFGAAPRAWVDIKLRELLKAAGFGRPKPIQSQAVYIAPPEDRRKERLRSLQARVIRQGESFAPDAELEAFVAELRKVNA